jgi:hypothetical protein
MSSSNKEKKRDLRSLQPLASFVYWIRTYLKMENLLHTRDTRAMVGILRVNPAICGTVRWVFSCEKKIVCTDIRQTGLKITFNAYAKISHDYCWIIDAELLSFSMIYDTWGFGGGLKLDIFTRQH